jgi:uncharacterized protein YbbC (DUF1343 family)
MTTLKARMLLLLLLLAGLALLLVGNTPSRTTTTEPAQGAKEDTRATRVLVGIDVLAGQKFVPLRGKRVGLITNQSGRGGDGRRTLDVLAQAGGFTLAAVFSPEHGLEGLLSGAVGDSVDSTTGLRVYSLYGQTRRPTTEMLEGLEALVFDIQDAGVRYYTYASTMAYAMEEAAKHGLEFFVLDRPNPLNGVTVEGPLLDADRVNFEGYFPLPLRHGMTLGELARLFNEEKEIGARLTVIRMSNWERRMWFDQTGLEWVNPSPNLRSLTGNTFYPAVELLRAGRVSVGRGTPTPFELFGAPWINGEELADYLNKRKISGVHFIPVRYRPTADVHEGRDCSGVRLVLRDREGLEAGLLGMELLSALHNLYPHDFQLQETIRLVGSGEALGRLREGGDPREIVEGWRTELDGFRKLRAKYLLY